MASSLAKMLSILDLYDEAHPVRTAEDICAAMKFSMSSGYRYIRELCAAGLLTRTTGGDYRLGIRIVELEYVMRTADPIAQVSSPVLKRLATATGCDALLSNYHGVHVINILHERGSELLNVVYGRGKPHPLFHGAVSKAILPFLTRSQLVKVYETHQAEVAEAGMGQTWLEFWRYLQAIKAVGFCESQGELDPDLCGLGVPVFVNDAVVGSLTAVFSKQRSKLLSREGLVDQLQRASRKITMALERHAGSEQASELSA